jgi:hypothetical protein
MKSCAWGIPTNVPLRPQYHLTHGCGPFQAGCGPGDHIFLDGPVTCGLVREIRFRGLLPKAGCVRCHRPTRNAGPCGGDRNCMPDVPRGSAACPMRATKTAECPGWGTTEGVAPERDNSREYQARKLWQDRTAFRLVRSVVRSGTLPMVTFASRVVIPEPHDMVGDPAPTAAMDRRATVEWEACPRHRLA